MMVARLQFILILYLNSLARLSQDFLANLQGCHKCGRASVLRTSSVVVRFAAFLRHREVKRSHCTVIARQAFAEPKMGGALTLVVRTPCVSCSSLESS